MCSPRNSRSIKCVFWSTSWLALGQPPFQIVYVSKVYVPLFCLLPKFCLVSPYDVVFSLWLGWPATEWETGPEPKKVGEMAGGHFWGFQNGQIAGQLKFGDFLPIRPFARPCFGHLGTPPNMAAGHFVSHSVPRHPSRNIFPCFKDTSAVLGSWNPEVTTFQTPKTLCFNRTMANFHANISVKLGQCQKHKVFHLHACTLSPLPPPSM